MIPIKTSQEIDKMRKAGQILFGIMDELSTMVKPGVATLDFDRAAARAISRFGAVSAFKGYRGYPAHICVSVNEEVVHGIPGKRKLMNGDIVSIDIGIQLDGFFADMAKTFPVGSVSPEKQKLIETARVSLEEAIKAFKPGAKLGDVSRAVQTLCGSSRVFQLCAILSAMGSAASCMKNRRYRILPHLVRQGRC